MENQEERRKETPCEKPKPKLRLNDQSLEYIIEQAQKRQLQGSEILNECVWYHMEHAKT